MTVRRLKSFVLVLAGAFLACGDSPAEREEFAAPVPVEIWSVPVVEEQVSESVVGTGSIAAHKTSNIGPRVDGIIEEIFVRVGDRVDEGAPLFRARQVEFRIRVDEARHALRLARAEHKKTARDRDRVEELARQGVASTEQLDAVRTANEIASARLGSAEATLARAEQNLADTVVIAPYAGVITARHVDEGVMMRTMLSANSHVIQLMKTDVVAAIVQIPALHLAQVGIGTPAVLHVDGLPQPYRSEVMIVNDRVDPASRAFEVRIPIRNEDLAVKPGLFVRAELQPEPRAALVVERRALLGSEGARHVFVASDGLAKRRAVDVRDLDAARVEVVSGLTAGDEVLVGPSLPRLLEGTPVAVRTAHVDF